MTLLPPRDLDGAALAYRLYQVTRDSTPWRVEDVLREERFSDDPARAERPWRVGPRVATTRGRPAWWWRRRPPRPG